MPQPWTAKINQPFAVVMRNYGDGRQQTIMATAAEKSIVGHDWSFAGTTPTPLFLGAFGNVASLINGELIFDLACIYNRAMSDKAVEKFTIAGLAMAAARGR